ncbi:EF-hand domain-containing protein [Sphingomonas sp. LB-2]|uniref:EF-hand domain-containing protein n=1 Tax=Sphingomonas caeni TaxID=2984949 RepID=UPI00222FB9CE|nr:EF-hand domain-containing protein [Sphingomonas caeni]MCW3848676.1 EF-hand domain-containing protein [Sphingomonas caeni]
MTEPVSPAQDAPQPAEVPKPTTAAATPAPAAEAAQARPPAQPAPAAQPASQEAQVAQIVNSEFASYDKDGNGSLDQAEFGAWMIALRVRAQPTFVADSPEGKAWVTAAFTQADADKNASVNATELTSFLTPRPAA